MEKMTDWISLWRELVQRQGWGFHSSDLSPDQPDRWCNQAGEYDARVRRRWARPDSSRAFVLSMLDAHPGATVLDIGAGTGTWAELLSHHARRITTVERSPAMAHVMRRNLASMGISNVEVVEAEWPDVQVGEHDFTLCAHAMYGFADLPAFVHSIEAVTRCMCFLLIRAPLMDSVMAQVSMRVWGHPYDSPDYPVAFNALMQMGLFPNVLMEDSGLWEPWTSDSLEQALAKIKRRFGLESNHEHDDFISDLLRRRLKYENGRFVWPRETRTAMLFWQTRSKGQAEPHFRIRADWATDDSVQDG